jgi:hypothetical protein
MRIHFLPLWHPKNDLDDVAEEVFELGEWFCEEIICLLDVSKCDFRDVDEAMFQVVVKP